MKKEDCKLEVTKENLPDGEYTFTVIDNCLLESFFCKISKDNQVFMSLNPDYELEADISERKKIALDFFAREIFKENVEKVFEKCSLEVLDAYDNASKFIIDNKLSVGETLEDDMHEFKVFVSPSRAIDIILDPREKDKRMVLIIFPDDSYVLDISVSHFGSDNEIKKQIMKNLVSFLLSSIKKTLHVQGDLKSSGQISSLYKAAIKFSDQVKDSNGTGTIRLEYDNFDIIDEYYLSNISLEEFVENKYNDEEEYEKEEQNQY